MSISPSGLLPSQLVQSAISITHACFLFPFLPIPEDPIKKHWQKSHNRAETTVSSGLPGSTATLTHLAFMQYHFLPQRKWATDTQGHSPFSPPPVIIAGAPPTKSHCETQFFACSWVLPSLLYLQTLLLNWYFPFMEKPTELSRVYPTSQLLFFDRVVHVMFHFFISHPPPNPSNQLGFY